jgi:hypothetical protein
MARHRRVWKNRYWFYVFVLGVLLFVVYAFFMGR